MPKATLTFNLPEEKSEFNFAIQGSNYALALGDILKELRDNIKYNNELSEVQLQIYEHIKNKIYHILEEIALI